MISSLERHTHGLPAPQEFVSSFNAAFACHEFDQRCPQLSCLLAIIGRYCPNGDTGHAGDQQAFGNGLGGFLLP